LFLLENLATESERQLTLMNTDHPHYRSARKSDLVSILMKNLDQSFSNLLCLGSLFRCHRKGRLFLFRITKGHSFLLLGQIPADVNGKNREHTNPKIELLQLKSSECTNP